MDRSCNVCFPSTNILSHKLCTVSNVNWKFDSDVQFSIWVSVLDLGTYAPMTESQSSHCNCVGMYAPDWIPVKPSLLCGHICSWLNPSQAINCYCVGLSAPMTESQSSHKLLLCITVSMLWIIFYYYCHHHYNHAKPYYLSTNFLYLRISQPLGYYQNFALLPCV